MDRVDKAVSFAQPKAVYNEFLNDDIDFADAPRNLQSVQDKKRYKQGTARGTSTHRLNFADEILHVSKIHIAMHRNNATSY